MILKEDVISLGPSQEDVEVGTKMQRETGGNWLVVKMAHVYACIQVQCDVGMTLSVNVNSVDLHIICMLWSLYICWILENILLSHDEMFTECYN